MESLILNQPWHLRPVDKGLVDRMAARAEVPWLIAGFLYQRGLRTTHQICTHLSPSLSSLSDPWSMKDMDRAVERLVKAVEKRERIGIFGDYDADGVTSSALLYLFFTNDLDLPCHIYLPHREKDGYGLNPSGIRELHAQGCTLVVTVDCGITGMQEVELARSLGMDVIITDHHHPPEQLPAAYAVLNPKRKDCSFAFKDLAGVGVAFNLVRALRSRLYELGHWSREKVPNLKAYLDLVALGTIADIVPLFGDNRILTRVGLEVLSISQRPGIVALKQVCGLGSQVTSFDVGFRLAPRVNAAGRMDHASIALELLITKDDKEALRLSYHLNSLNQERQNQEARILSEAIKLVEQDGKLPAYVLFSERWQKGIVGIVASRIVDQVHRPVLLLCKEGDLFQGSGRSPEFIDLYQALNLCKEHLLSFGGHRVAAGLKLHTESLERFVKAFQDACITQMGEIAPVPQLRVDLEADLKDLADPNFCQFFQLLEPFGEGYSPPIYALKGFSVLDSRIVGNNHLKLILGCESHVQGQPLDLLAWSQGDKMSLPWHRLELACEPCVNTWQGQRRLQLRLKDARYK